MTNLWAHSTQDDPLTSSTTMYSALQEDRAETHRLGHPQRYMKGSSSVPAAGVHRTARPGGLSSVSVSIQPIAQCWIFAVCASEFAAIAARFPGTRAWPAPLGASQASQEGSLMGAPLGFSKRNFRQGSPRLWASALMFSAALEASRVVAWKGTSPYISPRPFRPSSLFVWLPIGV